MHPINPHNPGLPQLLSRAQDMAKDARQQKQEKMAVAFQTVAMVSMAVMGLTAAAQLVRDLLRPERGVRSCHSAETREKRGGWVGNRWLGSLRGGGGKRRQLSRERRVKAPGPRGP